MESTVNQPSVLDMYFDTLSYVRYKLSRTVTYHTDQNNGTGTVLSRTVLCCSVLSLVPYSTVSKVVTSDRVKRGRAFWSGIYWDKQNNFFEV